LSAPITAHGARDLPQREQEARGDPERLAREERLAHGLVDELEGGTRHAVLQVGCQVLAPDVIQVQEPEQREAEQQERHEGRQDLEADRARVREQVVLDVGVDVAAQVGAQPRGRGGHA
jgi:hypothetical protein